MNEWLLVIGRMMLTEESRSTRKRPDPGAIFSSTNLARFHLGLNPGFREDRLPTNGLNHSIAFFIFSLCI
jgi:hypothetical protein